jgi:Pyridoxamine 5'-phosphate oxidase
MALTHTPETTLDTRFSDRGAVATEWEVTRRALETAELFWICTVRPDGRPHLTPIVAAWLESSIVPSTFVRASPSRRR